MDLTKALLNRKVIGIAYEIAELENGLLALLVPMSEVAGRVAVQIGGHRLEKTHGTSSGVLLGGVQATRRGNVTIICEGTF